MSITIKEYIGKKALFNVLSVSVLNQIVSSGTNFLLGIYLVRVLLPVEFGVYGIGFAICLFYAGIGNALFLTQMVVHTPDKAHDDQLPYGGRILVLVAFFCVATVLLTTVILLVGGIVWETVAYHVEIVIAVMVSSVAYLLKEFFARHAYNIRRETWVLSIHSVIAITMVFLLWMHHQFFTSFNVVMAFWVYAVAQTSGALLGCLLAKPPVLHQWGALLGDLREAWHGGKWASITNVVYFARTQAHTIIVVPLLGTVEIANLNASRLLVTPAIMFTPALIQVAMPRLAGLRTKGSHHVIKYGMMITLTLLAIALLYCTLMLGGFDLIVKTVLGEKYKDLFVITMIWSVYACLLALRNGAEMSLQVLKKFKGLSSVNAFSALVSLLATLGLTVTYGLPGALIGLVVGEVVLILLLYFLVLGNGH